MGGCEHATLDDAARSFRFGKMPSIWPSRCSRPGLLLLGSLGLIFSRLQLCIYVVTMYLHIIH